jgi:isopenicillin N synthase-like dioxygenase
MHAVDISNFGSNEVTNRKVIDALWHQIQDTGFCLISGTGIPRPVCEDALTACKLFLQEAEEDVRRSTLTKDRARRGYSPMCTENFATLLGNRNAPNDIVRKFRIGPLSSSGESSLLQPNVWPTRNHWSHSEFFQSAVSNYYSHSCACAERLVRAICEAVISRAGLQVKDSLHFLSQSFSHQTSILTLLAYRYGARHGRKIPLVAPHTDVGLATLLIFDAGDCAMLQRKSKEDTWENVTLPCIIREDPIFVLNIGDCLSDLSAGFIPSTQHQVIPSSGRSPRNCLALFVGLESEQLITLPNTGETLTFEAWRKQRIARAQAHKSA